MNDKPQNPTSYKSYVSDAKRTDCNYENVVGRVIRPDTLRLLHSAIGLCTESAELLDNLKKHLFYGKNIDRTNLIEEAGDIFWYLAILADVLGEKTFSLMLQKNIAKLKVRYPGKFTEEKAEVRDLDAERKVLDKQQATQRPKAQLKSHPDEDYCECGNCGQRFTKSHAPTICPSCDHDFQRV